MGLKTQSTRKNFKYYMKNCIEYDQKKNCFKLHYLSYYYRRSQPRKPFTIAVKAKAINVLLVETRDALQYCRKPNESNFDD